MRNKPFVCMKFLQRCDLFRVICKRSDSHKNIKEDTEKNKLDGSIDLILKLSETNEKEKEDYVAWLILAWQNMSMGT